MQVVFGSAPRGPVHTQRGGRRGPPAGGACRARTRRVHPGPAGPGRIREFGGPYMDHGWSAETDRPDESGTPFGEAVPPGVAATVPDAAPAWGASVSGATENDGPEGAGGGCKVRAESREPRAESREPRAESREPRAESREPRAESREPRAESREPRAESCVRNAPGHGVPRLRRPRPERSPSPPPSPAAPAPRGGFLQSFSLRRLRAGLARAGRRSLPAALLLALAALLAAPVLLAPAPAAAQEMAEVAPNWLLKPSGIARGGQFRLLFGTGGIGGNTRRHVDRHRRLQPLRAGLAQRSIFPRC